MSVDLGTDKKFEGGLKELTPNRGARRLCTTQIRVSTDVVEWCVFWNGKWFKADTHDPCDDASGSFAFLRLPLYNETRIG